MIVGFVISGWDIFGSSLWDLPPTRGTNHPGQPQPVGSSASSRQTQYHAVTRIVASYKHALRITLGVLRIIPLHAANCKHYLPDVAGKSYDTVAKCACCALCGFTGDLISFTTNDALLNWQICGERSSALRPVSTVCHSHR